MVLDGRHGGVDDLTDPKGRSRSARLKPRVEPRIEVERVSPTSEGLAQQGDIPHLINQFINLGFPLTQPLKEYPLKTFHGGIRASGLPSESNPFVQLAGSQAIAQETMREAIWGYVQMGPPWVVFVLASFKLENN